MSNLTGVDLRTDEHGPWIDVWACDQPALGASFQVVRAEWNATYTARTIYEVKLL